MMAATQRNPLPRRRLSDALSSSAPLVGLVGPVGAGASTALREWAALRDDITWASARGLAAGVEIDDDARVLIIDDADAMTAEHWSILAALRADRPLLRVRIAVQSARAVPATHAAELIGGLGFTLTEVTEYLSSIGSNLAPASVHHLSGGLPAAVRALAQLTTLKPDVTDAVLAELAHDRLAVEDALLAIPEVLTEELVAELGGAPDFIDRAERAGLGEWTAGVGHPLFILTAPVRAATRRSHPVEPGDVQERAAAMLLRQGAWYGALTQGAAMHALPVIDAALKGGGLPLVRNHGSAILEQLRDVRPLELRRWPVTAMALALIHNARHQHRVRAAELLGIALIGARSVSATPAERALLRVIESAVRRLLGAGDGGVKAALAAARILAEIPDDERRSVEGLLGDMHNHAGITLMYGARLPEALEQFENAIAVSTRPTTQLIAYGGIALMHALAGDLGASRSWIELAEQRPWPDATMNEYPGSMLLIARAWTQLEQNELSAAQESVAGVWHIIDTIEHWPLLAHVRAMIDICLGAPQVGLERVRSLRRRRGSRIPRTQSRLLDLTESSLCLAAGDVAGARALVVRSGDSSAVAIGAARVLLFDGQPDRALRALGAIVAESPADRAELAVLEAAALHRLGSDPSASVRRARAIAEAHRLKTPFLLVPADARALFQGLAPWRIEDVPVEIAAPRLTAREMVLLAQLVGTSSVPQIAASLHVSVNTIKSQRRSLYRKLGAASRDEALAISAELGILSDSTRVGR